MKTIFDIKNSQKGRSVLVLGSGGAIKTYGSMVKKLIKNDNLKTIGINNISSFHVPDYHVWTNTGRLKEFGHTINSSSVVLFGSNIKKDVISSIWPNKYISVPYTDKDGLAIKISSNHIQGNFRTAGCLSIVIAHILGFDNIYVAGMDGYTFNSWESMENGSASQHFYGNGLTDNNSKEICQKKDDQVKESLNSISSYGINFSIITPTIFNSFYNKDKFSDY